MLRYLRIFSALALAALISLTTASMAIARAEMSLFGSITLCYGVHIIELQLGPDGRPMEAEHICPECTIGALASSGLAPVASPKAVEPVLLAGNVWPAAHPILPAPKPSARGPPV